MRIERIELIGFKSFSDKTVFNFHPGITGIVGPNGCGKSNVVDAFRWVLGEQSAKTLRGEKMEEVIFNGSASKKPKGMAEVTIVVSGLNHSGQSPDDNGDSTSDIAYVTRRLYRSGESEYILNKNQCRLKDIKDLFLDTGLEVKSYSILEQEGISHILNSKPQDRRFLIEEVAGIMKYNVRKKEAIAKLELSRANLQRINDIISEVKKQINLLDRIAKKAERYKNLSAEINSIELKIAKRDYTFLKNSFTEIVSEFNLLREKESLKRAELSRIENLSELKRIQIIDKEKVLKELQIKLQGLEREIAEIEKNIAVSMTEKDNLNEYLSKLYTQGEDFNSQRKEALFRKEEINIIQENLLLKLSEKEKTLSEKTNLLRSLEEEVSAKEELLEENRRRLFRISEENSSLKNDLNRLKSTLEDLMRREMSAQKDIENLQNRIIEITSFIKETEEKLKERENALIFLRKNKEAININLSSSKNNIENIKETLSNLREEIASYKTRSESLKEIVFDRPTRDFLIEKTGSNLLRSISDIIEVDAEYEKAIEGALSEKINLFILPSFNHVEKAILSFKEKGFNRTAFLPLDLAVSTLQIKFEEKEGIKEQEESLKEVELPEGVIERASSFIKASEDFSGVAKALLGDIFIVRDVKDAINLIKKGNHSFFATLDGEVIEPSGVIIGGEIKGIFKRKREIKELEVILESKKAYSSQMEQELSLTQEYIEKTESQLRDIDSQIVEAEKELSLLKLTEDNFKEEKERLERRLTYIKAEAEHLAEEKDALIQLIDKKETEVKSSELSREIAEKENISLSGDISHNRSNLEILRSDVTDLRLVMASFKEKIESIKKEREALVRKIEEIDIKKEFLFEEISSVRSRISQRESESLEYEEKIKSLVFLADNLRKEISEKRDVIDSENQELIKIEQELKVIRREIESLSGRLTELDVLKAEHKVKLENISVNINQNYGLDIDKLEIEPVTPEEEEKLIMLKEKIQELGTVNLGSIEEYDELRSRYDFLCKQRDDLLKSITELEEAINKINATTKRRLREAYDVLRVKFSEVFTTLFGGGKADLILTDEDNILETGIEIIAQPPGKRLQNINLLSGGEKALTALSLLFASFLIKPTPLCILDEADATLDESNTERFAKMIQELSKDIQFIVVTHNKTTMSVADYLYGITMEEAGVSKVLSMQLVEV
ncbi:MAG: chromosome segregation protein SMC [Thermodesulfovibrionales bacterium]